MEQLISIIIADIGYEEANLRSEFRATCIRWPILIKLQLKQTPFPYLLGGIDLAYFINAEFRWYEFLPYFANSYRGMTMSNFSCLRFFNGNGTWPRDHSF